MATEIESSTTALTGIRLSFRPGTSVEVEDDAGTLIVSHPTAKFRLRNVPETIRGFLQGMADSSTPLDPTSLASGDHTRIFTIIGRLGAAVRYHLMDDRGRQAMTLESMCGGTAHQPAPVVSDSTVKLSRFALLRADEDGAVLESPLTVNRIRPHTADARALITALDVAVTSAGLAERLGLPVAETSRLLGHLVGAGLVHTAVDGIFPDAEPVLRQWEFHDLLFHSRSRIGRHDYAFGGVFPFRGEIEPRPAVRPAHEGPVVSLPRPDLDQILQDDPQLTTVLEARKSTRVHGERPLTLDQLGEFLYRTARVRAITEALPEQGMPYPATSRPYPTGGASYDLELYLSIHRCEGVEQGVYHYDPLGHSLTLVNSDSTDRDAMLAVAQVAAGNIPAPDVLITLTSRFQRLGWKYRSIPYSATLKNVGVLYQTMYLVATAMGLGGCGLGGGNSDLSARVFHLDYLQESSVGEFILGSLPSGQPQLGNHSSWVPANDHGWHSAASVRLSRRPMA